MSASGSNKYRRDIDGLRAVAVSAVLLFHGFPNRFPGGFVGVDIFFVISGFLISGIIFDDLRAGTFSFVEFYSRRIRRIFPALLLVCGACLLFGWLVLLPDQFRRLGLHTVGGALFSSNFVLLNESGYFDVASALKPLRHLWSLGIEEQYYLLWPVLLFLASRQKHGALVLLLCVGLTSFAFNIYITSADHALAYYLPVTRFWELMVGSALAYLAVRRRSESQLGAQAANAMSGLGILAIGLSLALINERRAFPGWWALLVCAGSALCIAAGPNAWINRRILGSKPFVHVGLISYPLYLWHWPLISFATIMLGKPSASQRAVALVMSFALATLTYRFLELPIRRAAIGSRRPRVTLRLLQSMCITAVVGALVGLVIIPGASAGDQQVAKIAAATADWESIDNEFVPGSVPNTAFFFGDSHMEQYWPRVEFAAQRFSSRRAIEFRTTGGCAPIPGIERRGKHCASFVADGFMRAARPDVDIVVLAAQWSGLGRYGDYYRAYGSPDVALDFLSNRNDWAFTRFSEALAHLRQQGKRVIVLLSSPTGEMFDPGTMIDHSAFLPRAKLVRGIPRAELAASFAATDSKIRSAAQRAGAEVIDPMDWFCEPDLCQAQDASGRPISTDGSHIRASVVREKAIALDDFVRLDDKMLRPRASESASPEPTTPH